MQIWLLESMPKWGVRFATKVSTTAFPRCMRWALKDENLAYNDIARRTKAEGEEAIEIDDNPILTPEEAELELMDGCVYDDEKSDPFFDDLVAPFLRHFEAPGGRSPSTGRGGNEKDGGVGDMAKTLAQVMDKLQTMSTGMEKMDEKVRNNFPIICSVETGDNCELG